jgi:hypothetical protein
MTKVDRIRRIAQEHPDWKTSQIGKACDCRPEYVRVVLRQRVNSGMSEIDRRYLNSPLGISSVGKRAERKRAYFSTLYKSADRQEASRVWRDTYRNAKKNGLSIVEARGRANTAYMAVIYGTADKSKARAAYRRQALMEASP